MWKFISNKQNKNGSQSEATEIRDDNIQNKKRIITKKSTKNTLQRKRQKISADYKHQIFYDFRFMIVYPHPKMDSEESNILFSSFGISSEKQSNEVIS